MVGEKSKSCGKNGRNDVINLYTFFRNCPKRSLPDFHRMSEVQKCPADTLIVVIGGMGPLAGIDCLRYITDNCKTDGTDQDNLNTILLSCPSLIESRVDFIMGVSDVNPANSILRLLEPQLHSLKTLFKRILIGASCITFHCPKSFSVFEAGMKRSFPDVEIVSLISSTVTFIKDHFSESKRIAIMSTDGTRKAKPFESEFLANGFSPIYLSDAQQAVVTECIYNHEW